MFHYLIHCEFSHQYQEVVLVRVAVAFFTGVQMIPSFISSPANLGSALFWWSQSYHRSLVLQSSLRLFCNSVILVSQSLSCAIIFQSFGKVQVLFSFLPYLTQWFTEIAKSISLQIFFFLLTKTSSGDPFVSKKKTQQFYVSHFHGQILIYVYTISLYDENCLHNAQWITFFS